MEKYALYHPTSGKYLSNYFYDRKNKHYTFHISEDIQDIWTWNEKSHAERQLSMMFPNPSTAPFEVQEFSMTVPKWNVYDEPIDED